MARIAWHHIESHPRRSHKRKLWLSSLRAGNPPGTAPLNVTDPLQNVGDVDSITQGLGESFYLPISHARRFLGGNNASGEPRIDTNFPGFNLNISDQRRAKELNSAISTEW